MPCTHTVDPQTAIRGAKFSGGETVEVGARIRTTLFADHVNPVTGSEFDIPAMDTATIPLAA